ncbi:MAG: alcohol dehydrogenase catalytic domain-containing protein [Planctomycetota bacterium]|jgi:threonine dehydrogenase-like Zn-dependent dehydrogenase|nr:alcohol dehydrogenase catalytic domain-containing protein [Planctomycetota bacterium]
MIPQKQTAIQLVGPDQLALNTDKPVHRPGPRQILGKVECVGLCFSDMKLLKQFDGHARKSPVLAHLTPDVLKQIPTYVPNDAPTVPGHEVVLQVVEVGEGVTSVEVGKRYLVQADWRELKTEGSNGAFGYNFEGGLQQYVLVDERCSVASDGTNYLLEMKEGKSVSATALVEPWACVEQAFIHRERTELTEGGTLLYVKTSDTDPDFTHVDTERAGKRLCLKLDGDEACACGKPGFDCVTIDQIADTSIDDILFAGADADVIESLMPKLATNGLLVIATCGGLFARDVSAPVGRVHYGNVRLVGYHGDSFAKALARIPETGELRPGDHVHVIGAAGPMGSMATIRVISEGMADTSVEASDMAEERLAVLERKAAAVAKRTGVPTRFFNPKDAQSEKPADYVMVMVPVGPLVAGAVRDSNPGAIINIFAGIQAEVSQDIDLDGYVRKGQYFIGTSGSTMEDMYAVQSKVESGTLDTNLSVGAVSGMGGAIEGLEAVKTGAVSGKILVYPVLGDFPMTSLDDLVAQFPSIGPMLDDGCWTKAAEEELLRVAVPQAS